MKKIIFTLVGISFLIFSCQNELLDLQESSLQSESFSSSQQSGIVECKVIDADRSPNFSNGPYGTGQPAANLWWSLDGGYDYWITSTYYSSSNDHSLKVVKDGDEINITGSTINENGCIVEIDVFLVDKKNWDDWSTSSINGILGTHKKEGTAGNASDSSLMSFYVIDSSRSTLTATGNCDGREGKTYGLEQRPDSESTGELYNFGAHVGPGGANYDSNIGAIGLSTWGHIFDLESQKRLWVMDFNFLIDDCKEVIQCKDCEGNVTELTLQYNGTEEAYIEVKTKDEGVNGSKIVFEGNVGPGDQFTINGNDENGTFGKEIKVYVDGDYVKIKTDCSEAIGPGLIIEDIEVISGKSSNGAYLCPIPCDECEGKVTKLELQYNGDQAADIRVETKKEGEDGSKIVFERLMVEPGDTFSFTGNDKKGTLGTEITIYVNGTVNTKIHTSCSKPIGPGLVSGDFEVISGSSREGGALCPVDTPPGGGDDCNECEGKVTRLDLVYNGDNTAQIDVVQKKDDISVFSKPVNPGETFSFSGMDDKGTLGTEIIIYVNYQEAQRIHTSCSDPIGAGAVFGDFTVEGGASREGGELCPVDVPPTNTECECKGGIVSVTFTYNGNVGDAIFTSDDDDAAFTDNGNGTVTLATSNGDKLSNPEIFVNGISVGEIHASCSDKILGLSYGPLTVVEYIDKEGNVTSVDGCSQLPPGDDCNECDGKVTNLELQYSGSGTDFIKIVQKKDGEIVFNKTTGGNPIKIFGVWKKGTFGTELIIYVEDVEVQRIHTSCSVPIGVGSVFGKFTVLSGASLNGGEFCNPEGAS